jgi:tetratricopeptide (TPR) repeat protein
MQLKRHLFVSALFFALTIPAFAARKKPDLNSQMNRFYELKSKDPKAAKEKLEDIVAAYPNSSLAQAEMGYLLTSEGKNEEALEHFRAAEKNAPQDPQMSMQLGYVLDSTNRKKEAYKEFEKASLSKDEQVREEACLATINLAPVIHKKLPDPYFADVYFSPSYNTRFDDGIFSLNLRGGVNVGPRKEWDVYAGFRGVRDTESRGGNAPQIFSDNVGVFALGARYIPLKNIPLSLYAEAGMAYDLLDRNRDRWRDDVRAGALMYTAWGAAPHCPMGWQFPFRHVGNFYADVSVYSRYDWNWIGYARVREGLRVVEKGRSSLDAYLHVGGVVDSDDEFFNNLVEVGPGLAFVPDHRWNITFRYYVLKGNYLKVNGPSSNPYKPSYTDRRLEAECYWRF